MPTVVAEGGVAIAYRLSGKGPPVLFIQGVGVPASGWQPQVDGLSDRYECASIDNRGLGASGQGPADLRIEAMAADALMLMDHLGWETAHVVGHSMGGLIAQELALSAPSRIRSLTLMCTFLRGADAARLSAWILWIGVRTYVGTRRMRRRAFLEMILAPDERDGDIDALADRLVPIFGRDVADPSPMAMRQLKAASRYHAGARLAALRDVSTLVLQAQNDRLALPEYGRALCAEIPGARYHDIAGAHGIPITRATEVNALLAEHFEAAERARALPPCQELETPQ